MIKSFADLKEYGRTAGGAVVAIAGGDSGGAVEFAAIAEAEGIGECVFVGEQAAVEKTLESAPHRPAKLRIHRSSADEAAAEAVRLCLAGEASFVMKGNVKTNALLKAVLHTEEKEIREGGYFLSHTAVIENPRGGKLLQVTDGGMNVAPDAGEKVHIMQNALCIAREMGIGKPKVLFAAGMEDTGQDIPAIADAREIIKRHKTGEWPNTFIDGPFGVDVGLDPQAAKIKKLDTEIRGDADIIVVPNLEAGNIAVKMVLHYMNTYMLGLIIGGVVPVLLVSRGAPPEANLLSAVLAQLISCQKAG
jgi:phosphate butyryltransferase